MKFKRFRLEIDNNEVFLVEDDNGIVVKYEEAVDFAESQQLTMNKMQDVSCELRERISKYEKDLNEKYKIISERLERIEILENKVRRLKNVEAKLSRRDTKIRKLEERAKFFGRLW